MICRGSALAVVFAALPLMAQAQSTENSPVGLAVELNTIEDVEGACRLTFLVENETGATIDSVSFQLVFFDSEGGVAALKVYDFGELPASRPRVRRFVFKESNCGMIGHTLINGVSSCVIGGSESDVCADTLTLRSRTDVELLG